MLFDWNGTIMDDMERARRASSLVRQRWTSLGKLTSAEFREAWCLPVSAHIERLGVPKADLDAAARAWSAHLGEIEAPLSPCAATTLEALRRLGVETAVVSSATEQTVQRDLRAHGLDRHFERVHCGIADKAAVTGQYVLQAGPGAVWYVGDTTFDMTHALSAGATAIGYTGGFDPAEKLRDAGAHRLIDRLDELLALIPQSPNEQLMAPTPTGATTRAGER